MTGAPAELSLAHALLARAEASIRLLDRVVPSNVLAERQRLSSDWAGGERSLPKWSYRAPPPLTELRAALNQMARQLETRGPLSQAYAARALELDHEAALVAAIGTKEFRRLARERYADPHPTQSEPYLERWLSEPPALCEVGTSHTSDDAADPASLLSQMERALGEQRLPFRSVVVPELASLAATGQGVVLVASQRRHTARQAARVVAHELRAHVLPRVAASAQPLGLLRVGCAGASDDEEGRALLLEERAGYLDTARTRELALRHRAATLAHAGANFVEILDFLLTEQVGLESGLAIAERVLRGGGLGREAAYLPAYLRVRQAFAATPELERWFERGRASLAAARNLAASALLELGDHRNMV